MSNCMVLYICSVTRFFTTAAWLENKLGYTVVGSALPDSLPCSLFGLLSLMPAPVLAWFLRILHIEAIA